VAAVRIERMGGSNPISPTFNTQHSGPCRGCLEDAAAGPIARVSNVRRRHRLN